ncbi:MAG TPA: glycosyltransferase family 2 protein [Opitutus sp.]|nr:glycosyltransferase family 2 protein [Opitutus sp.]
MILPTCDRPQLWPRALRSVLEQDAPELEVLLVDSNRRAPPVRDQPEFARFGGDARVRLIEGGPFANAAAARNAGLRQAAGEWVSFLDDDDEYAPGKISRQLALAREKSASIVLCGFEVELAFRRRLVQVGTRELADDALLLEAVWSTPFLFHRRDPTHFFDARYASAEDLDYALRFLAHHRLRAVPNVPDPLVQVHLQQAGRTNTQHEENWRTCRHVLKEQRPRFSREAGRRFLLRAILQRHKGPDGSWAKLLGAGGALVREGGAGEIRRVANACLLRTGWFDRWLVS